MNRTVLADARRSILLAFFVLGTIAAIAILPYQFRSGAVSNKTNTGLFTQTVSHDDSLPNYDIRSDKKAFEKIASIRGAANKDAAMVADIRDRLSRGEENLRSRVPSLKVEYNSDMRIPEVISPDVQK